MKTRLGILAAVLIAGTTICHYTVPVSLHSLHEVFKVLYFLPILLAAYAFGFKGGLWTAALVTVVYLPHVMFQWGGGLLPNLSRFLMIVLYNGVGGLTGLLWQRQRGERDRYQKTAEDLALSLEKLEGAGRELAEIEGQLRSAERLATMGELTASLAHEVRNPLGSIRGVAEILRDEMGEGEHRRFVEILLKETGRLDEVVANYLSYAKPRSVEREKLRLDELVDSVLSLIGPELRRHRLEARVEIRPDEPCVWGNQNQLRQALLNVVLNAVQAAPAGTAIEISASREGERVRLSVADEGPGAPPETLERLFEPFYTTREQGTGLGLAITRRIVDNLGGTISAANRRPRGLDVVMELPVWRE